jgi:hypothetical protein
MKGFNALYPAICRDNNDPQMTGRIRVEVPYPLGTGVDNWSTWAKPCLPPGTFEVPEEGQGVWVMFANGEVNQPVWLGIWFKGKGSTTQAPFQEPHAPLTDFEGNNVDPDQRDHGAATDPVSDEEHKEFHDHGSSFYTPHRFSHVSHTGHTLEWNDHPGKEGAIRFSDRFGRMLEATARGILRLRSFVTTSASGDWSGRGMTADGAYHEFRLEDGLTEGASGPFVRIRAMCGSFLRMLSTPGSETVELVDSIGQRLRMTDAVVEVVDSSGQFVRLDVANGKLQVQDAEGNAATLENGKITIAAVSGNIVLNVSGGAHVHIGGEAGQELATKAFVQGYFNVHTHLSSAPGTPTGPPMIPAPLTPGGDITKKQKSE